MADFLGFPSGEKGLTTSFEYLVDGLSTSQFLWVKPRSTNRGDVVLMASNSAGTGIGTGIGGMRLEPSDPPVKIQLAANNRTWQVKATVVGTTVGYIGQDLA